MPEGLTNAPAAFQRFMNDIFMDMIDINVIVYLDDILVYSDDLAEHKRHVREVLWRLRTNGLFACADKCECHITSCEYLGYMLSPDGLMMAQGPKQSPNYPRLARTTQGQGHPILPRFRQLLPSFHL